MVNYNMAVLAGTGSHVLQYRNYVIPEKANLKDALVLACGVSLGRDNTFSEKETMIGDITEGMDSENEGSEDSADAGGGECSDRSNESNGEQEDSNDGNVPGYPALSFNKVEIA